MSDTDSLRSPRPPDGDSVGPARWRAFTALAALERGKVLRLRNALRVDDLAPRERGLALELTLGVERRRITLDAVLVALTARGQLTSDSFVRTALRIGAYQLLFLPRVPGHAAVHTAVALLRAQKPFVNALLRRLAAHIVARGADPTRPREELALPAHADAARALVLPAPFLPDPELTPSEYDSIVHGVPGDLLARWHGEYGAERARAIAAASAAAPSVTLRVQRTRTHAARLQATLASAGVATVAVDDGSFLRVLDIAGASPFATPAYHEGLFYAQDRTAFAAAAAVAPVPGENILDLCAAPGGKATALAEMLAGRGAIFAHDTDRERLAQVREAVARLRLQGVVHVVEDLAAAPATFDAVLVDVPCSNTGVLARRVEVRRRSVAESLARLVPAQAALLRTALARTRPRGRAVYSTCSLEREENRAVVDAVLADHRDVVLEREQLTLPVAGACDGGYFAVLRRS